ncbi:hypothetical protein [Empedobacter tilapiae]|uniref:hypothetical protein n=1 Tax=Empedobacter tilapiae TaxID=2491114 RepID=UPI0028D73157|nr:hypothetical protein [Empedobacter tilapiae]
MKVHFSFLEVLYLAQVICCFLFIKYTDGLGYMQGNDFYYTSQLQSSGGEDEVSIYSLGLITILFLFISILSKRKYRVLSFYLLFAYFSLFLIQMGEIDSTILNGNFVLLIIVVINLFLTFYFWLMLFKKIKNYLNQEV